MSLRDYGIETDRLEKVVRLDAMEEPSYGSDQAYIDYPARFATVRLALRDTLPLCKAADSIRMKLGFSPMFADESPCDSAGWYNFFLGLNDFNDCRLDNSITFEVENTESPDEGICYEIGLSDDEREAIFAILDGQCRTCLGMGCEDLLDEARQ